MDGQRLSELRKDRHLTQKQLAKLLNLSENTISAYERNLNDPDDTIKLQIAKLFNVSLDYLMGLSNTPTPLEHLPLQFIIVNHLPECAIEEMQSFVQYIKDKYNPDK